MSIRKLNLKLQDLIRWIYGDKMCKNCELLNNECKCECSTIIIFPLSKTNALCNECGHIIVLKVIKNVR